jgi:hypothetical protein
MQPILRQTSIRLIVFGILLSGCNNTVGTLELKGKVVDESTKAAIPNLSIMVEALDESNDQSANIYAGDFTTDSSGCFAYTLKKVKNKSLYNFYIQGNPDYDPANKILGLSDLHSYGKFLTFEINRIVDFTMKINRNNNTPIRDTLIVSWETNGVDGKTLYPYKIINYQINSGNGLIWIGGDVKSEIKTKVYAGKNTIVHWELYRNGRHKDIIDTIFCTRDATNSVYLNY